MRPRDWLVFSRKPMVSPTGLAAPDFSAIFAPATISHFQDLGVRLDSLPP
jgi:hypothetical protein